MTLPPCKVNGVECDKRCIGCQSNCEAYHDWLITHEAEKEAYRRKKYADNEVAEFINKRSSRIRVCNSTKYQKRRDTQ